MIGAGLLQKAIPRRRWERRLLPVLGVLVLLDGAALAAGTRWRIGLDPQINRCLPEIRAVMMDLWSDLPPRGGLIVFEAYGLEPAYPDGSLLVKLLTAQSGDLVEVSEVGVKVNGELVAQGLALATRLGHLPSAFTRTYTVPDGHFLALGTAADSLDGRYYGTLPLDRARGAAWKLL